MKYLKSKKYSILSNLLKYSFVIVIAFIIVAPIVFAKNDVTSANLPDVNSANVPNVTAGNNPDANIKVTINNPLGPKGPQNIQDFIKAIVQIVLYIGIPVIALAIIYTGFLFVAAQGNSEKLTDAKKALVYTLIGGALLLGAFVIADAIGGTVDQIKKGV